MAVSTTYTDRIPKPTPVPTPTAPVRPDRDRSSELGTEVFAVQGAAD